MKITDWLIDLIDEYGIASLLLGLLILVGSISAIALMIYATWPIDAR